MTKEQITNKAKKLGWNVEFSRDKHKRVTFENWTPYGQDIILEYEYKNLDEIREQLKEEVESFDVSYETYLWLDENGHGKNGSPYEMKDILLDMEKRLEMEEELLSTMEV